MAPAVMMPPEMESVPRARMPPPWAPPMVRVWLGLVWVILPEPDSVSACAPVMLAPP